MYRAPVISPGLPVSLLQDWAEEMNFTTVFAQSYVLSAIASPVVVASVLAHLQFQPQLLPDGSPCIPKDEEFALEPLNHGQWQNIRSITESPYEGWFALLKGTHHISPPTHSPDCNCTLPYQQLYIPLPTTVHYPA